jgi:L-ascorbate metabolism protein UlaG (beta-lactamase superfamily)
MGTLTHDWPEQESSSTERTMKVTYYGHSCFRAELAGKSLLFDPYITPNELAQSVDISSIPADYILLSHAHQDHVADAVTIAKRTSAQVLCNFELSLWLNRQGINNVFPMNHGGTAKLHGVRAKLVNAIHSSSLPDGSYGGNPGGWIVESAEGNFYFSGDTALTADMKLIGETTRLRWAALCLGDTFTMGIEDAILAASWVGVDQVLGVHYDTFPPIRIDHAQATQAFRAAGRTLHLPPIGGTLDL